MLHLSMSSFDAQKLHLVEERASVRMGGDVEFRDDFTAGLIQIALRLDLRFGTF